MKIINNNKTGFTLLEILLVVAAIAILAGIVIVAINPGKQLGATRNASRNSDVNTIINAVYQYALDNNGVFPSNVDSNLKMIGTSASGCSMSCTGIGGGISTSTIQTVPISFLDNSQITFNGTFSNTQYDINNSWVKLISGTTGTYTSSIKDATSNSSWNSFAWIPNRPTGKNLPNNKQIETGYPTGNADMTGNVLLTHLDEVSGATTFSDSSGNGNNGSCGTTICPTMTAGILGNTPNFSAGSNFVKINDSNSLKLTNKFTLEAWFNQIATTSWTSYGNILEKGFTTDVNQNGYSFSGFGSYWRVFLGNPSGGYAYQDITWLSFNTWIHMVFTFDNGLGTVYLNGNLFNTHTFPMTSVVVNNLPLKIGSGQYNGYIDEVAIFNRVLSATEIADTYKRGALNLKHQIRSCASANCSDASFVGPDNTANTFYSEINNNSNTTPAFNFSNLAANRYIQYKTTFNSAVTGITPELNNITITGSQTVVSGGGNTTSTPTVTIDSCIDLSPTLVSNYITSIPFDPKIGNANKTYYAIRKTSGGRINIVACSPENLETINITK